MHKRRTWMPEKCPVCWTAGSCARGEKRFVEDEENSETVFSDECGEQRCEPPMAFAPVGAQVFGAEIAIRNF